MSETPSPCTRAVRAGIESDTQHGAVVPPLHLSTNYAFTGLGGKRAYDYSRSGNPTRDLLGEALAELEQGAVAVITASGMAAVMQTNSNGVIETSKNLSLIGRSYGARSSSLRQPSSNARSASVPRTGASTCASASLRRGASCPPT